MIKMQISVKMENLKRRQKEILELENTITDMKNSLKGFRGRFKQAGERINKLENRTNGSY